MGGGVTPLVGQSKLNTPDPEVSYITHTSAEQILPFTAREIKREDQFLRASRKDFPVSSSGEK